MAEIMKLGTFFERFFSEIIKRVPQNEKEF